MSTKLTEASMQAARQWYVDHAQRCIDEVESGAVEVNDVEVYYKWCKGLAEQAMRGDYDHTLSFLQRAHYIQTGECIALLPM